MTEKRFVLGYNKIKDKEENIVYGLTSIDSQDFGLHKFIEKANALHKENQHLRESLKKEYMAMSGNLCDACKHEEQDNTNNWFVGIDYDVKCNQGHEILLDDEEQKCEDFELRLEGWND